MGNIKRKFTELVSGEKFSSSAMTAFFIAAVVVFNVILFTLVEVFGFYLHSSKPDDLTLTGNTEEMFSSAKSEGKKVKIMFCLSESDLESHSTGNYVYETAKHFEEENEGFIEVDYINLITRRNKNNEIVDLAKYKKDMQGNEIKIYKSTVIFECGNNYKVLTDNYSSAGFAPFYTLDSENNVTSYNGEEVIASMISWVLNDEHKTAYFTQYHGEIVDIAFSNLLTSAGYNINVIDLRKEEVPSDAGILIISNPTSDFESAREGIGIRAEMDRLKTYMENGGNLYVALDPYVRTLPALEGFLSENGIKFSVTETKDKGAVRNIIKDSAQAITPDGFTIVARYADTPLADKISQKVEKYSSGGVLVREVSAIELSLNAKPLLVSSSGAELEADGKTVSREGNYCIAAYAEPAAKVGVSKIFVIPSIYMAASGSLVTKGYSNREFIYSLAEDFYGAQKMPYGCKAIYFVESRLENLTMGKAKLYTAAVMLIPAAFAALGAVITVRRKNR